MVTVKRFTLAIFARLSDVMRLDFDGHIFFSTSCASFNDGLAVIRRLR